ncbi:TraR/DksA C4-type zinc finger protein [Alkalicoccus chagannorensis]|uniref:TraR/DksA C4-type zinc finger protein n=1 Tax=Alkalicoccus chagannorensis TaxID=427072 RepID=UPI00041E32C0|nr:TraR/DksA C4-type zinc finger protein [Alkalicoccus chagannorensis]
MDQEHLHYFQDILLKRKEELQQASSTSSYQDDELSSYDNHPADQGSELAEEHTEMALSRRQQEELNEIDEALKRMEDGSYGICEVSGEAIPVERLELVPTARTTVENSGDTIADTRPPEEDVISPIEDDGARDSLRAEFWEQTEEHGSSDADLENWTEEDEEDPYSS